MPLGRLASGSWSQLSAPTLDKTRPLLADKRESINARGQKSTPRDKECAGLIWFTALSFWLLLLVPIVGVAFEIVDVEVVVALVLLLLRCRFGLGGAAEQLESLKRDDAK